MTSPGWIVSTIVGAAAAAALACAFWALSYSDAPARGGFPSVLELQHALQIYPGTQLPRDVQAPSGQIFHAYVVGGSYLGNGKYSAIIELR